MPMQVCQTQAHNQNLLWIVFARNSVEKQMYVATHANLHAAWNLNREHQAMHKKNFCSQTYARQLIESKGI